MVFIFTWSTVATLALLWGVEVSYIDYSHIQYGFPIIWAIHQLATGERAVDTWQIDSSALLIDLAFWLTPLVVSVVVLRNFKHLKKNQR